MFTVATCEGDGEQVLLNRAKPPKENHETMEDLKDMLVVTMQNMMSNNDLVTQLTQKVVQNMLSVGQCKVDMEGMKKSYTEEIAKLQEQIASMKEELRSQIETVDAELKSQIEDMEAGQNTTLAALSGEIREEISQISSEVTIVSAEQGLRDQKCAKVCAGTTGRTSTTWVNYSTSGMHTTVDISGCGFVTVPTVTTSLEGASSHWTNSGGSEIYSVTTTKFVTYINAPSAGLRSQASTLKWNMEWIAVGYTC